MSNPYPEEPLEEPKELISRGDKLLGQRKYGDAIRDYEAAEQALELCNEQTRQELLPKVKNKLKEARNKAKPG
jgi:hypothetical protein